MKYSSRFVQSKAHFFLSKSQCLGDTDRGKFVPHGRHHSSHADFSPKRIVFAKFSLNHQNNDDFMILIMLFSGPDSLVLLTQKNNRSSVSQYGPQEKECESDRGPS